jgi:uncharacterized membrane protein YbaN (DUF454 family)
MRLLYLASGLGFVAIGGVGVIVPGLPTTVFFIMAAWCFSRSSRRLENWVLNLPGIGPMVRDYRSGLGMPRRAKVAAISCMVIAVGLSAGLVINNLVVRLLVVGLGIIGVWYVGYRVPTRETVLAEREAAGVEPQDSVGPPIDG